MPLAIVSAALSQKKLIFRYGGFLNMVLMGCLGTNKRALEIIVYVENNKHTQNLCS